MRSHLKAILFVVGVAAITWLASAAQAYACCGDGS